MYKASYKDIKWLLEHSDSKEVKEVFDGFQPEGYQVAYYASKNNNWGYVIKIVKLHNKVYEVVTVFGEVKGGRLLYA